MNTITPVEVQTAEKTHVRYWILLVLFVVTTINHVDRATLSMAAPAIRKHLAIDPVAMGYIFAAFGWSYAILQIPGGWLLDRFGSRLVYGSALFFWSLMTFLQGLSGFLSGSAAFAALLMLRFLLGIAEAPAFPGNSRIVSSWFPVHERGFSSAVFNSAQYFALAAFTPLMGWILAVWGWQAVFYSMGVVGILLGFFWFAFVNEPGAHPMVNQAEIEYIRSGGGLAGLQAGGSELRLDYVRQMLKSRMLIGVYIGQFGINTITWFFLTWFPTYLVQAKGMSILKAGLVASIPALLGFAGGLLGGYTSDWLLRRGRSLTFARKTPIILGMTLSSCIVLANYVTAEWVVIALMSLAFCAKGFGALGWVVVSDTSPKEMVGLSGGIFNFAGNLASVATPVVIGYILAVTDSFNGALLYVGSMGALGALSYLLIVGDIRRLELKKQETKARL
ncbi:MAG: MFS transporter [Acidobacteria bacterium]|nr:MAG: MFS transporter [Acidobacteriota bacterium]